MKPHLALIYFSYPLVQDDLAVALEKHLRQLKQKGCILFLTAASVECFQLSQPKLDPTLFYNIDDFLPLTNLLDSSWGFDSIYIVEESSFRLMHEDIIVKDLGLEPETLHGSGDRYAV